MATILGISGSMTKGGSTRAVIDAALAGAKARNPQLTTDVIDLRSVTLSFCDGRPFNEYADDTPQVVNRIQAADAFVIGTPIYRGSYTGSLKNLLDHVPVEAMMGKVVGLVATAATDHHYLSIDQELRPVLMWFNAHLVPGSVYVRSNQLQGNTIVDEQVSEHLRLLGEAVADMQQRLSGGIQGPPPLSLWGRRKA
ncbi:MAG: NAD(P)H-dependent oxidoreductase [Deltaproteobacteria bacterium]|nr:NAD(P)H-dependent oxidoreductase [Deltaproteobacteria bacterium]